MVKAEVLEMVDEGSHSRPDRVIIDISGDDNGPLVIAIGGMHGNEQSGVIALERLAGILKNIQKDLKGRFLGIRGNTKALAKGERFLEKDLNRLWRFDEISGELKPPSDCPEKEEYEAINELVFEAVRKAKNKVTFIDLHTTSSKSEPFILISDTLSNREFVKNIPAPVILGLDELLDGPMLTYMSMFGDVSMAFEAGQHDDPKSVEYQEAMLWMVIGQSGLISKDRIPHYKTHQKNLKEAGRYANKVFEVFYRYGIVEGEQFKMWPGFRNLDPVKKDQILAINQKGNIVSKYDGQVFMPRYQDQGDDGFFVVRSRSGIGRWLSETMRKLKLSFVLRLLPGVKKLENRPWHLTAPPKVVKKWAALFNFFGYRRKRKHKDKVLLAGRQPGRIKPEGKKA